MKPVFANSGFIGVPERLVLRGASWKKCQLKVRFGLFVHPQHGPVLIDTGYGPETRYGGLEGGLLKAYHRALRADLQPGQMVVKLLEAHGFTPRDVGIIIVTHFHADHVAQLNLFPNAGFVARASAFKTIQNRSLIQNMRHANFSCLLPEDFGARLTDVEGLGVIKAPLELGVGYDIFDDGSVLGIDLPGHAEGHFGVCFPKLQPPLLYGVDVQWHGKAIAQNRLPGFPASLVANDMSEVLSSAQKVQKFQENGGAVVLCHDPADTPYDFETNKETP
jgi:glyoxylase-like metal-dependent hydrolase (beta-lactamase superfamily II)